MGQFGEAIKESTKPVEKRERVSTGSDFIRLTPEHTTVIRILDEIPTISWSHFVPKKHSAFPNANAGKGMSFMCPGRATCPICKWNSEQWDEFRKDTDTKEKKPKNLLNSRKVYTFNVLDRTVVVTCPSCGAEYYETKSGFPEECSNPDCGASLADIEAAPRNKIQIFQKGIKIAEQFIAFEDEFGDINSYDVKLDTRGTGDQSNTICVPKPPNPLNLDEILGENWQDKLYNITEIIKPMDAANITRILNGEDFYTVFKKKD
jgi:hypothetical protein